MGDMGADVVKVERPGKGVMIPAPGARPSSWTVTANPTGESGYYLSANRNKRSLAIDITSAEAAMFCIGWWQRRIS